MKILLTTDTWTPTINGVVTSAVTLRRQLTARGHEVRVLTLAGGSRTYARDGVTYLGSLDAGLIYPGARLRTPAMHDALAEMIAWGPDVVHSQCEFSTFAPARRIARACRAPLIHTYHTVYEDYTHYFSPSRRMGKRLAAGFSRWICARTDAVIAPTEKIRRLLAGYGVMRPIRVIPTGLELERFAAVPDPALRGALGLPQDKKVLLYLGRLAKEKNIEELISAMALLPQAVLLIVGDGPERPALEQLALARAPGQVLFAGAVLPEKVPAYYALADAFVSASTSEAQGLTYVEALAAGLPLLCRDDACVQALIRQGRGGWMYRDRQELVQLVGQLPCGAAAQSVRAQARAAAEPYGAEAFAEAVEGLYREQILKKHRAARPAVRTGVVLW